MLKKILIIIAILVIGSVLFMYSAFWLLPERLVHERAQAAIVQSAGVAVTDTGFRKVFPAGYEATELTFSEAGTGRETMRFDTFRVMLSPLALFTGRLKATFRGSTGKGLVDGYVTFRRGGLDAEVNVTEYPLAEIPAIEARGVKSRGRLNGRALVTAEYGGCPEGFVKARIDAMQGSGITYQGLPLPFGNIDEAGLDVDLAGCDAIVHGIWLDGEKLNARLTGRISLVNPLEASALDLKAELMPKGSFAEEGGTMMLLRPYRKSASFYSVNIGGTVRAPVLRP